MGAKQSRQQVLSVTVGVDTHRDAHVAAAVDATGRTLGWRSFGVTVDGYRALLDWAQQFGPVDRVGVEGTGCWGAGLTRFLLDQQMPVVEVLRSDRKVRRLNGKSDPLDAEAAARAALNGTASVQPKAAMGGSRRSARCPWPATAPSRPAPPRPCSCTASSSARPTRCAPSSSH